MLTIIEEHKKVKELVLKFLKEDPQCRNSDKILTYKVFQEIAEENGKKIEIPFDIFDKLPSFESIRRSRAYIRLWL